MYPPCPHGNAFGHNLKRKARKPSLLAKTELLRGRAQDAERHSPRALHPGQNGMLSAHTFPRGYPGYWGKFYRAVNTKSLHFTEITPLLLTKMSAQIFFGRRDMKSHTVLGRGGDDNQITSRCWHMTCQSLGSSSAGRHWPGDATTANHWMLNGSENPAEECWALTPACRAEVGVHEFQASAQSSRFCGKIQIWAHQWGKQPGCWHAGGEVYLHAHRSGAAAAVASACLGSGKEPVHHQVKSTAF